MQCCTGLVYTCSLLSGYGATLHREAVRYCTARYDMLYGTLLFSTVLYTHSAIPFGIECVMYGTVLYGVLRYIIFGGVSLDISAGGYAMKVRALGAGGAVATTAVSAFILA